MKWISVKEKLPEIGDKVLMFMAKFGDVKNAASEYFGCWLGEHWSYWDDNKETDCEINPDYWRVTHWMPLPPDPSQSPSTEVKGQQDICPYCKVDSLIKDNEYIYCVKCTRCWPSQPQEGQYAASLLKERDELKAGLIHENHAWNILSEAHSKKEKECEYWKQRCEAAEDYIHSISYHGSTTPDEKKYYTQWQNLKNEEDNIR